MTETEYKPDTSYRQRADIAEGNFFKTLSTYADCRLIDLATAWRLQFPKCSLKIIFGNGDEHCYVNGVGVNFYMKDPRFPNDSRWSYDRFQDDVDLDLTLIADALEDVWYICDGYARACPNDIEVLPEDSELGGKDEESTDDRETGKGLFNYGGLPGYDCPRSGSLVDPVHTCRS